MASDTWLDVSQEFQIYWNFPHVCGAIDGKQCRIRAPPHSGSLFYCYKGYYSIVLLGISDAQYRFLYVNIGAYGSSSDAGVLAYSELGNRLASEEMNFPEPSPILEGHRNIPYFLIGDEAFGLKNYSMIPYPGRYLDADRQNFNYRLSRARRVVENAFGILTARWRIYHREICAFPRTVDLIIKGTVVLHNLLCTSNSETYVPPNYVDREVNGRLIEGQWRTESLNTRLVPLPRDARLATNNVSNNASVVRDYLKEYLKHH